MQANETWVAQWVRGLVKTIFIGCYIAFMWASIHHVAAFFNDFEADNGNTVGSYLLASAFDITALVTTVGVMFFRKSMPTWVFWIVWTFIIAIAGYSFFINWEYASHYQNMTLLLQPTGETTAVYDTQGVLHYVPVMQVNTSLLGVNPILASGFTIFSLIYSVIAEFFGTKAPTAEELLAKKKYLEETASILEDIKKLEGKDKKPGFIQRTKETFIEAKEAVKEVMHTGENEDDFAEQNAHSSSSGVAHSGAAKNATTDNNNPGGKSAQDGSKTVGKTREDAGTHEGEKPEREGRKTPASIPASRCTTEPLSVSVKEAAALLGLSESYVRDLKKNRKLRSPGRNKNLITVASIHAYKQAHQKPAQNEQNTGDKVAENTQLNDQQNRGENGHHTAGELPLLMPDLEVA
jgi:hypothetical protein